DPFDQAGRGAPLHRRSARRLPRSEGRLVRGPLLHAPADDEADRDPPRDGLPAGAADGLEVASAVEEDPQVEEIAGLERRGRTGGGGRAGGATRTAEMGLSKPSPSCRNVANVYRVPYSRNGRYSRTGKSHWSDLTASGTISGFSGPPTTPRKASFVPYPNRVTPTSRPATNWTSPTGRAMRRCHGISPPSAAVIAIFSNAFGSVNASTGAASTRSPGISQNGSRSRNWMPERAGVPGTNCSTNGSFSHGGHPPEERDCSTKAASTKTRPSPWSPRSASSPRPRR